ncbi:hypothetical protein Pyn_37481 [Prunus yedoensis var. nudiflora]|uniref:Uncharacterized protein n=1 Tax=Prunus yedoensis var. nudiflora TaxID=2094558 RepID=A0A314YC07_PRUYE|nr:hypothetical protein Pyn_37481 [Prunus yedoensis var. nudiflora]
MAELLFAELPRLNSLSETPSAKLPWHNFLDGTPFHKTTSAGLPLAELSRRAVLPHNLPQRNLPSADWRSEGFGDYSLVDCRYLSWRI